MGSRAILRAPVAGTDDWMDEGACAGQGPAAMFPAAEVDQAAAAEEHCTGCPVRRACLAYALTHGIDDGVWGGITEAQRRRLRRSLKAGRTLDEALDRLPAPKRPPTRRLATQSLVVLDLARRRPDGITAGAVAKRLGVTHSSATRRLAHLTDAGHLQRVERGLFVAVKEPARA